jgi:hypothetical protein
VTLRWVLPIEGDIEMAITSRGWHWDEYYLQRMTLRWLLFPEGDMKMTITSRGWYKENLMIIVAPDIYVVNLPWRQIKYETYSNL